MRESADSPLGTLPCVCVCVCESEIADEATGRYLPAWLRRVAIVQGHMVQKLTGELSRLQLDTGRYTPECLTEREQVKHVYSSDRGK